MLLHYPAADPLGHRWNYRVSGKPRTSFSTKSLSPSGREAGEPFAFFAVQYAEPSRIPNKHFTITKPSRVRTQTWRHLSPLQWRLIQDATIHCVLKEFANAVPSGFTQPHNELSRSGLARNLSTVDSDNNDSVSEGFQGDREVSNS